MPTHSDPTGMGTLLPGVTENGPWSLLEGPLLAGARVNQHQNELGASPTHTHTPAAHGLDRVTTNEFASSPYSSGYLHHPCSHFSSCLRLSRFIYTAAAQCKCRGTFSQCMPEKIHTHSFIFQLFFQCRVIEYLCSH